MAETNRRDVLRAGLAFAALPFAAVLNVGCASIQKNGVQPMNDEDTFGETMKIHFLEIVTPDVEATCNLYSKMHGVTFGEPVAVFGNARTAQMGDGVTLSIRAPMHDQEKSVVRPYVLVEDIESVVAAAAETGAVIAVPPMEIPGHGMCAVVIQGSVEAGLWQTG